MAPSVPPAQTDGQNLPAGCCKGSQKLPDGVIASIIVVIESELKLRQLIEMGEKLHLAYSVGRAPSDQQSVIKQEVIDLTYEPELEERPAEAHISQSLPGPSQINTAMNVGQPSLLSTLPFLQNKQFYYDGSSPYGNLPFFPMTDNVNPYSFGFRPRSTLAASAGNASFPSSQNSNGGFNVGPSASPCLAPNFDGQSPFTAEVWNREESEGEEDERIRSTEDEYEVHRRRRSKKRIRGHCENGVFRDSQLSFRLEQGRVRHACQEIGCRSSLGQGYVLQHVRLHCKRMPHVSPQDMAERCFPRIAWTWLS